MTTLKVLLIGGSGVISSAVAHEVTARGHQLSVLNRGHSQHRPLPEGARLLQADVTDPESVARAVGTETFDTVVDWLAYTPEDIARSVGLFAHRTNQYVFISSASAYHKPPRLLPIRESTPLRNPYLAYSRGKIAAEDALTNLYRQDGFPMTIVRPSHTYDQTTVPFDGGWTVVDRMRRGLGVVVPGDGTSLWTITHSQDFARAFVTLLGRSEAIGEAFHITADQPHTWNAIYTMIGHAAGVEPKLVHVTSDAIAAADSRWGAALLGDKSHSMIFDNTKIRGFAPGFATRIPFDVGAKEIIAWHDAETSRRVVDAQLDAVMNRLVETYRPRML